MPHHYNCSNFPGNRRNRDKIEVPSTHIYNLSVGTGVTSGAGTANPFGAPELIPVFIWVRVTRSLVLCVVF
jgi:hypothetical protein